MPRALDHLVLASRDLGAQADLYRQLGFQVGARNTHPWGTQNHIVQLHGAFLELLGLGDGFAAPGADNPAAPFAGFLADYLARDEGLAMLALRAADARADHAAFAATGIGVGAPFHVERAGKRADGSAARLAFTLAFARSKLIPDAGFFSCQQHHPENFWSAAGQAHPNTAKRLAGVVMVAENPSAHAEFLSHFTGEREILATSMGIDINTGGGRIEVLTPLAFEFRFGLQADSASPHFAAFRIGVADMQAALACLSAAQSPLQLQGARAIVPPAAAFGCAVVFEPDAP